MRKLTRILEAISKERLADTAVFEILKEYSIQPSTQVEELPQELLELVAVDKGNYSLLMTIPVEEIISKKIVMGEVPLDENFVQSLEKNFREALVGRKFSIAEMKAKTSAQKILPSGEYTIQDIKNYEAIKDDKDKLSAQFMVDVR